MILGKTGYIIREVFLKTFSNSKGTSFMTIETLKNTFPDYAKDTKLNLSTVLTEAGSPELSLTQIWGIALASAFACKNKTIVKAIQEDAKSILEESELNGIHAAVSIMAMNNIYYRATHLISDKALESLPARLRMNIMANPGISKINFELYSLAVSAITGCGKCLDSHTESLKKEGFNITGIQSCLRISAVIHATAQTLWINDLN